MIERHSIPWYTNHWGTFGRITNSFNYCILDPLSNTKNINGKLLGRSEAKQVITNQLSPDLLNHRELSRHRLSAQTSTLRTWHQTTSHHGYAIVLDSVSIKLPTHDDTQSMGTLPEMRDAKNITTFSSFLGTNTSKSETPENKTQKFLLITNKHRLLFSRHSSEISCYHGHCAAIRSRKLHIAVHKNHLTILFSNHFAQQKSPNFNDTKPWTLIGHRKTIHTQTTHRLSRPHGGGHQPHPTTDPPGRRLQTWSNFKSQSSCRLPWSWTEFELTSQAHDDSSMSTTTSSQKQIYTAGTQCLGRSNKNIHAFTTWTNSALAALRKDRHQTGENKKRNISNW